MDKKNTHPKKDDVPSTINVCDQYIPGLELIPISVTVQANLFKPVVNTENIRQLKEFQVSTLVKNTPPVIVNFGYDKKAKGNKSGSVALVNYKYEGTEKTCDFLNEQSILCGLNNENILNFYGVVYDANRPLFAFECFEVFLSQLICTEPQIFDPSGTKCVMFQLLKGLQYLHDKRIVHRDITPKNLVFTEKGVLKISNFKNSQSAGERSKVIMTAEFSYQPVDVLLESKTVTTAIDIWSATCVLAELVLKRKLFRSVGKIEVLAEILGLLGRPTPEIWPEFVALPDYQYLTFDDKSHNLNFMDRYFKDNQTLNLLQEGFTYNPQYRLCAEEFMKHSYFYDDPKAMPAKIFGGLFIGKEFTFPVEYE